MNAAPASAPPPDLQQLLDMAKPFVERIVEALTAPRTPEGPKFVTVDEAAQLLGLAVATVKRLRKEGKLKAIRNGRHWAYLRESVLEWKP
ncbi:MAG: helix-turn-helix domain-containing protein [Acidobacteriia bacterium]|nr:helix-turn-helix domain-containing protein [Terriglobia bacterium]